MTRLTTVGVYPPEFLSPGCFGPGETRREGDAMGKGESPHPRPWSVELWSGVSPTGFAGDFFQDIRLFNLHFRKQIKNTWDLNEATSLPNLDLGKKKRKITLKKWFVFFVGYLFFWVHAMLL